MVTVGTQPCRPRICWLGPMPRPGEFSGSTRTSWNLTQRTSSSSPANPQPASPETEGCSSRFSKIWQSRHTLPMVRANKMQSNLCSDCRRPPCPTSKHAAKWARQRKSQTGFAAGAFWRLLPACTGGTSYRHRLSATAADCKKTMWLQCNRDSRCLIRHPCPPCPSRSRMPNHDKEPCLIAEPEGRREVSAGDPCTWDRPPRCQ